MKVTFSEITNNKGNINKSIDVKGKKSPAANVWDAKGSTKTFELENLKEYLESLNKEPKKAVILGVCGHDDFRIVKAGNEDPSKNIVSRTKKHFKFVNSDNLGLMYFDVDSNSAHGEWDWEQITGFIEELEKLLYGCFLSEKGSAVADLCMFVKKSGGSSYLDAMGNANTPTYHIYFPVKNPDAQLVELIFKWAWLNGFTSHLVSAAGTVLCRSIIDEAVKSPERLVFESDFTIPDTFTLTERECDYYPGGAIDSELAIAILEGEVEKFDTKWDRYKKKIENSAEVIKIRNDRDKIEEKKLMEKGLKKAEAKKVLKNKRNGVLLSSFELTKDDNTTVEVYDILTDPDKWDGATGFRPPLEPEYGKGKCKIFVNSETSVVMNSQAHGGEVYILRFDYFGLIKWLRETHHEEIEDDYIDYLSNSELTDTQLAKISKQIAELMETTVTNIKGDIKESKKEAEIEVDKVKSGLRDAGSDYLEPDSTHDEIAEHCLDTFKDGYKIYGSTLYSFDKTIWKRMDEGRLLKKVASDYRHCVLCRVRNNYVGIVKHMLKTAENVVTEWTGDYGIPCSNKFWFLTDDKIEPVEYTKEIGARYKLSFEPNFDMKTPLWDKMLDNVVNQDCFQKLFGLLLAGALNDKLQMVGILKGPGGVGKGTTNKVLSAMLPPGRMTAISLGMMNMAERVGALSDSYINIVGEVNQNKDKVINMKGFKEVTGGDLVTGRNLFQDPFTFISKCGHLMNMNQWPKLEGFNSEIARRVKDFIVEFQHNHVNIIPRMDEQIIEHELPGVLAWAIKGVQKWIAEGTGDDHSTLLFNQWSRSVDTVEAFFQDCCSIGGEVILSKLAMEYNKYCEEQGYESLSRNSFYEKVRTFDGIRETKKKDNRYFLGITVVV